MNIPGSFQCHCKIGYAGDGLNCTGKFFYQIKHLWLIIKFAMFGYLLTCLNGNCISRTAIQALLTSISFSKLSRCITAMAEFSCIINYSCWSVRILNSTWQNFLVLNCLTEFTLRLPYTFRGVSRPSDVARPV